MLILFLYYITSHIVSFTCSIYEAVLLSTSGGYVSLLRKKKPKVGAILTDLKARIDRPLAAILTLNTAAHTIGAAGVGAKVVELYGNHWLALASGILTLTMLYFTEMIPKTLGALYWKRLLPFTVYSLRFLIVITYPFVYSFEWIAKLISQGKAPDKITGEEIKHILEEGTKAGVIQEVEHDMLESIFRLGNRRVAILMVPRMNIEWLDLNEDLETIYKKADQSKHSRFPVCEGELDKVVGIISSKDLLEIVAHGKKNIRELAKPPFFVPENMRVVQLLELFKTKPNHIALVTNEYGGVQGMITLHDVLESIVGDVPSSAVMPEMSIVKRGEDSWMVDGMLPIDELKAQFDIDSLPDEEKGTYHILGGFCMRQIGSIPSVGDTFTWQNLKFKIIKMNGRRVDKVLIQYVKLRNGD